ncbi:MAG: SpoIIE family protein phosphatase [Methylococcales bacterium]|nr:SpoIIE family protein phosphatase [Methylococcales bacterium]
MRGQLNQTQERTAGLVNANAALEAEISEHRQIEAELKESEERFRQITAMTGEWILEQDTERRYIYSSSGVKGILGLKPEEVIGKYYYELFAPEDKAQITPGIIEAIGSFFHLDNRNKYKGGHEVFTESSGSPILDLETKLLKWRGIYHDITERKHFEDTLRLRDCAIEASSVGIIISDANQPGRPIIHANAGHNHPLLLRQGEKTCKDLDAEGLILGVKNEVIFEEKSLSLEKGDMVLLYTDGITEARNKEGEFFGVERLTDLFVAHRESTPQCVIDMVVKELRDFCQSSSFNDDISMVVLKIT